MPIYVLFSPSSFGVFKSALVLKPDHGPRFQVSLITIFFHYITFFKFHGHWQSSKWLLSSGLQCF